ncbi:LAFA_0D01596g1_1 [Lachancea sp. 'fantastica']|nr:LAFA_0D01596g1_1 [Lachancea sp. 'fantastica']
MANLRVEVDISTVQIIKRQYALYRIDLIMIRNGDEECRYHAFRRFSEFLRLRQDLENEIGSELPYELPARNINGWLKRTSSCDPDVIEFRKRELSRFLYDLLNDSFDSRWKKSPYMCHFLQIPSNWADATLRRKEDSTAGVTESTPNGPGGLKDPQKWLEELRNCKILLAEAVRDRSSATKIGVKLRLRIQDLETSLKQIDQEQLVGTSEIMRRHNLLSGLKTDLNDKLVEKTSELFSNASDSHKLYDREETNERPLMGRKIGETTETLGLNDQELLQLHKDTTKKQDLELEKLRQIILSQKDLSLSMNQELSQQNELLDLMSGEVDSTANKLRMANRGAKRVNES